MATYRWLKTNPVSVSGQCDYGNTWKKIEANLFGRMLEKYNSNSLMRSVLHNALERERMAVESVKHIGRVH